jgi:hypothetical protein
MNGGGENMPLTPEQRQYVVRSVIRILKDVNRDEVIAALKEDVLEAASEEPEGQIELDLAVLAVAEACRERLRLKRLEREKAGEEGSGGP